MDEVVGQTFEEHGYKPELAAKLQSQLRQVVQTGEVVRDSTPFTDPTGGSRVCEYIFVPVRGATGAVAWLPVPLAIQLNVTWRKSECALP